MGLARRRLWLLALLLPVCGSAIGDADGDYALGRKAYEAEDLIDAIQYLERAAGQGHVQSQLLLGYILDKAEENAAAMGYYQQAAAAGSGEAAHAVGTMYANGDGVARDLAMARDWYQRSAMLGYAPALETLGIAYVEGGLGLQAEPERGAEMLREAAALGRDSARRYLDGLGRP